MELGKILSLKNKINSDSDLSQVAEELAANWSEISGDLFDALLERIESGNEYFFSSNSLTLLIIASRDPTLYRLANDKKLMSYFGPSDWLRFLEAGLTSTDIEQKLCQFLEGIIDKIDPYRTVILEGLRDYGSIHSLDNLIRLEYEYSEFFQTEKVKAQLPRSTDTEEAFMAALEGKTAEIHAEIQQLLKDVIRRIKERGDLINDDWLLDNEELVNSLIESVRHEDSENTHFIDIAVADLVKDIEKKTVEFKESLRGGQSDKKRAAGPEYRIMRIIAAFANTKGGVLLIGVHDNGKILGLKKDFDSLRGERDEFQLHLKNLVDSAFGIDFTALCLEIDFEKVQGNWVCKVVIKPSNREVFLTEKGKQEEIFFVRGPGATKPLYGEALTRYCRTRFAS